MTDGPSFHPYSTNDQMQLTLKLKLVDSEYQLARPLMLQKGKCCLEALLDLDHSIGNFGNAETLKLDPKE